MTVNSRVSECCFPRHILYGLSTAFQLVLLYVDFFFTQIYYTLLCVMYNKIDFDLTRKNTN